MRALKWLGVSHTAWLCPQSSRRFLRQARAGEASQCSLPSPRTYFAMKTDGGVVGGWALLADVLAYPHPCERCAQTPELGVSHCCQGSDTRGAENVWPPIRNQPSIS